ncbi:hypothetical protein HZU77_011195 [Neisseriaceae bacterium TC5R-5]|nr:hypothetical protein [Neisseriaceae bacterium TC5R-5]
MKTLISASRAAYGWWLSLGFIKLLSKELEQLVADFGNLVREGAELADFDEGRAKELLTAFNDGCWHSKVENGNLI